MIFGATLRRRALDRVGNTTDWLEVRAIWCISWSMEAMLEGFAAFGMGMYAYGAPDPDEGATPRQTKDSNNEQVVSLLLRCATEPGSTRSPQRSPFAEALRAPSPPFR